MLLRPQVQCFLDPRLKLNWINYELPFLSPPLKQYTFFKAIYCISFNHNDDQSTCYFFSYHQIQKVILALGDCMRIKCHACIGGTAKRKILFLLTNILYHPQMMIYPHIISFSLSTNLKSNHSLRHLDLHESLIPWMLRWNSIRDNLIFRKIYQTYCFFSLSDSKSNPSPGPLHASQMSRLYRWRIHKKRHRSTKWRSSCCCGDAWPCLWYDHPRCSRLVCFSIWPALYGL